MTRLFLASIAVVSALAVVPYAGEAQKKGALAKSNQVYVKIIWPTEPAARDKDRPVVESWIAEELKKRGQSKFTAATAWVPLAVKGEESTRVWNGGLDGKAMGCPTTGHIVERADGRIKVLLWGWGPGGNKVTVSLPDEPGSREIAAVERIKTEQGKPCVAVLIGPPPSAQGKDEAKRSAEIQKEIQELEEKTAKLRVELAKLKPAGTSNKQPKRPPDFFGIVERIEKQSILPDSKEFEAVLIKGHPPLAGKPKPSSPLFHNGEPDLLWLNMPHTTVERRNGPIVVGQFVWAWYDGNMIKTEPGQIYPEYVISEAAMKK